MNAPEKISFNLKICSTNDSLTIKTLGHPTRLKILSILNCGECCVKHIWECLGVEQATISQHLAVLKKRGIIVGTRKGTEVRYAIENPLVQKIISAI